MLWLDTLSRLSATTGTLSLCSVTLDTWSTGVCKTKHILITTNYIIIFRKFLTSTIKYLGMINKVLHLLKIPL